jgi:hypothetical protein
MSNKHPGKHHDNTQEHQEDRIVHPVVVAESRPTAAGSKEPKKRWYRRIPWWRVLEGIGILSVIAYAVLTYLQWHDLRSNFKLEQRAWIAYTQMSVTNLADSQPLRCDVKIVNSGKTFALDVDLPGALQTSYIGLEDAIEQASRSFKKQPPHSNVIFPGVDSAIPSATDTALTPGQVSEIRLGRLKVYLFGDVKYKDIFKEEHVTHYCGHYIPATTRFEDCGSYAN